MRVKKHITWCVYLLSPAFLYSTSAAVYGDVGELPTTAFDFIVIGGMIRSTFLHYFDALTRLLTDNVFLL